MSAVRGRGGAGAGGCLRVKAKLKQALEQQNYYEAHQMYRTLFYRLGSSEKFSELELLLYEGSLLLHDATQTGSAVDLTKCYLEVLAKRKEKEKDSDTDKQVTEEAFQRVAKLYALVPLNSPEKDGIMVQAIQWSTPVGSKQGHPRLHQMFAYNLWNAKRYQESRHHFLYSCDGAGCGSMLAEFHSSRGFSLEVDLFIASTVLQLVVLRKHIVAARALQAYTEKHPTIKKGVPPYQKPLLNFVWLLLVAIETKQSLQAFSVLVEKYKGTFTRDPSLLGYLDKIGEAHFGVPPRARPRPGGMFAGLFENFFSALNDDDDDEEDGGQQRRPAAPPMNPLASLLGGMMPPQGQQAVSGPSRPAPPSSAPPTKMETEDLD